MNDSSIRTAAASAGKNVLCMLLGVALLYSASIAQESPAIDSDHDGLSDALEQALLIQFQPVFMVARHDCSSLPSEFKANISMPQPAMNNGNGTIYGQVFPARTSSAMPTLEIHYYHLWARDCGGHGHPLDSEHVSALVRASESNVSTTTWKAVYWYAAAHENTVCDVSQIARASTLHAEDHGAKIWISPGKHASYFNETLCQRGCGADRCEDMMAMAPLQLINLGETGYPMNGSLFISSPAWPLAAKMTSTNFPASSLARLDTLPEDAIALFNPGRHPAQGVIAISSSTEQAITGSGVITVSAISGAADSTGTALSTAHDSTGNALQKSYRHTRHALGVSVRNVGRALHLTPKATQDKSPR